MRHLDEYLLQLEESVQSAGGHVHWARDAAEANRIIAQGSQGPRRAEEVVKVKSIATDETGLNEHLEREGITALETDLAELIIQLAGETSSHILVPAIHKNRAEIRELFMRKLGAKDLSDNPTDLTNAARLYLREKFLVREGRHLRGELRGRRDGDGLRRRVRGQRPDVHDAPAGSRYAHGDREGHPGLA